MISFRCYYLVSAEIVWWSTITNNWKTTSWLNWRLPGRKWHLHYENESERTHPSVPASLWKKLGIQYLGINKSYFNCYGNHTRQRWAWTNLQINIFNMKKRAKINWLKMIKYYLRWQLFLNCKPFYIEINKFNLI